MMKTLDIFYTLAIFLALPAWVISLVFANSSDISKIVMMYLLPSINLFLPVKIISKIKDDLDIIFKLLLLILALISIAFSVFILWIAYITFQYAGV